jgi:hypothetical protein
VTTHNAKLNDQATRNAQIRVLAMQYALQSQPQEQVETVDELIARAERIFEFMKDTQPVSSLAVVHSMPEPA